MRNFYSTPSLGILAGLIVLTFLSGKIWLDNDPYYCAKAFHKYCELLMNEKAEKYKYFPDTIFTWEKDKIMQEITNNIKNESQLMRQIYHNFYSWWDFINSSTYFVKRFVYFSPNTINETTAFTKIENTLYLMKKQKGKWKVWDEVESLKVHSIKNKTLPNTPYSFLSIRYPSQLLFGSGKTSKIVDHGYTASTIFLRWGQLGIYKYCSTSLFILLKKGTPSQRRNSAWLLGYIEGPGVTEVLIKALDDPIYQVRIAAIRALARQTATEALPKLKELAEDDPEPKVRKWAKIAMERIIKGEKVDEYDRPW